MSRPVIPDEAVEAAALIVFRTSGRNRVMSYEAARANCQAEARRILEAVAPHFMTERKPKPGAGDYIPGWDDRKTLAELWQQHAPLPECGLRAGTYDALIAVAKWGYDQRASE